jgi:hypothetical protein
MSMPHDGTFDDRAGRGDGPSIDTGVRRLAPKHREIGFQDLRRAARIADVDVVVALRAALGLPVGAAVAQRVGDALRAVGVEVAQPIHDAINLPTEPKSLNGVHALDADAFTRSARTVRELCGASPAVCAACLLVLEVDADANELICRDCGGRWPADSLTPCPRPATARVRDEEGHEDRLCAAHATIWRRLVALARSQNAERPNDNQQGEPA